jgi:putative redox protein
MIPKDICTEADLVKAHSIAKLAAEILAKKHTFLSGVATSLGGADEGPDPHELLEAALAACTIITVQMYANRKGWNLHSTDVTVHVDSEGKQSKIIRAVSFQGDLNAEQKQRLEEIADKCPIHNLLQSQITIETKQKD